MLDELGVRQADGSVLLPTVITLDMITGEASTSDPDGLYSWFKDRANRRVIPHRLETCGYVPVRNMDADDGLWKIGKKRQVVYGLLSAPTPERIDAAAALAAARKEGTTVWI